MAKKKSKVTVPKLIKMKEDGKLITMLTAYDYTMAKLVDQAGADVIQDSFCGGYFGSIVDGRC